MYVYMYIDGSRMRKDGPVEVGWQYETRRGPRAKCGKQEIFLQYYKDLTSGVALSIKELFNILNEL